jgi:hypothetical protein
VVARLPLPIADAYLIANFSAMNAALSGVPVGWLAKDVIRDRHDARFR